MNCSVSIATTFREDLAKVGVVFCSISEAIREYPEIVKKYLGSVVPVQVGTLLFLPQLLRLWNRLISDYKLALRVYRSLQ